MFDPEFFPTPASVIEQMGLDCHGKVCLEPQAGKGNLAGWLRDNGAAEVLVAEKHADLRQILSGSFQLIAEDFFTVRPEQISHVQLIAMNPPFSSAARHILHAWKTAPEGCEIVSLCNWETLEKGYMGDDRRELIQTIENYGESLNLGACFKDAERRTDVEIGLVRLFKPKYSTGTDFDGFYLDVAEERGSNGVMQYNEIRAIVNNYVAAVNCFDRVRDITQELYRYTSYTLGDGAKFNFGGGYSFHVSSNKQVSSREGFARELQLECWKFLFGRMNLQKYVTKGVMADINKFIQSRSNYPFTMKNIYRMFEIIVGTREQTMNRAIEEAIDNFTKHTHENRFGVEGWKTNSGYLLNKKFISGWISEVNWGGYSLGIKHWNGNYEHILDLTKALCYVTGRDYSSIEDITYASCRRDAEGNKLKDDRDRYLGENAFDPNTWYDWGFFRFKVYKKGTGHFQFKNEADWHALNQAYAKIKGQVLPEKVKP